MKTKISKRTVMVEALAMWRMSRVKAAFAFYLKMAWRIVKERVVYYSNRNDFTASNQPVISVDYIGRQAAYNSFYANTKYFGD